MNKLIIVKALFACMAAFCCLLFSCNPVKISMAIPDEFTREATKMPVAGIGNGSGRREISFGNFKTSRIKRGWNISSSKYDRGTRITNEERVLRAFGYDKNHFTTNQKDKFRFTIQNDKSLAEVYAMERKVTEQTRIKIKNKWVPDFDVLKNAQHSFSAVIITGHEAVRDQWQLVMYSSQDPENSKGKNIFERYAWNGNGFVTNGKDTMIIRTVKIDKVVSREGKISTMPLAAFTAYEFRSEDAVSAIVDTFGKNIWMYNELDETTRLIIASVSAAVLLRRIASL